MSFLLHLTYTSGATDTKWFPSRFDRALWMVALAWQPVTLRPEDRS